MVPPPAASNVKVGAAPSPRVQVSATLVVGAGIEAVPNAVYVPKLRSAMAATVHTEVRETETLNAWGAVVAACVAGIG